MVHRPVHLFEACPTPGGIGLYRALVGRVLPVVVDAAGVQQKLVDGDGVGPVAAGAQGVNRLRGQTVGDGVIEGEAVCVVVATESGWIVSPMCAPRIVASSGVAFSPVWRVRPVGW